MVEPWFLVLHHGSCCCTMVLDVAPWFVPWFLSLHHGSFFSHRISCCSPCFCFTMLLFHHASVSPCFCFTCFSFTCFCFTCFCFTCFCFTITSTSGHGDHPSLRLGRRRHSARQPGQQTVLQRCPLHRRGLPGGFEHKKRILFNCTEGRGELYTFTTVEW